jgi:hypothetical protein
MATGPTIAVLKTACEVQQSRAARYSLLYSSISVSIRIVLPSYVLALTKL